MINASLPSSPNTPAPVQAVIHCREITRDHSKTFFLGSRLFPLQQRQAVWAVYAACRNGDDIVDESGAGTVAAELDEWWTRVQAAFAGRAGADPVDVALAWAARTYPIPLSAFAELHDGLRMDLNDHVYRDMDDLTLYCRRVAGVIGFMIAPVSGYSGGEQTLHHALLLGQAMQLTNILRDVGEDLTRGRVYLPQSLLTEYGVTRADLERGLVTPQYRALMAHLCALARVWYAEGRTGIPFLHGSARLAVATAARAYEGILDDLERAGYDNFNRRAYVSGTRKLLMLPRAWWELRGAVGG
ncbi:phytoene/squalene synthase family protein [Deinococcus arenicola]|uniref:Phytoene/squalene synthase family protein n=1 Tax=Deinococcus arenicola TaxID=2994950 RepID=A0ABU4DPZ9_9DEIO|nr:phytoene/squalene synthase family protein [Deinococcus sp. ZS9-10]MDV6374507.1 phytoene/squalene synthase family protein [Deinococcus sp. ZS9-10]